MKRWIVGLSVAGALAAAGAYAQDRGPFRGGPGGPGGWAQNPMSPDDMAAFTDARIAALHAGLKLTPDQEKLWPPVEEALRGLMKQRREAREARRERFASMRETGEGDIPGTLRFMADRQAASADALRKLADATQPLHGSLDDAQKRRLRILARPFARAVGMDRGPGGHRGPHRWQRGELGPDGRDFALDMPAPEPRR